LKPGEKVVVEGLQKIKAGVQVTPKPWTPPNERVTEAVAEAKPAAASGH
jgi:hypothetical protein